METKNVVVDKSLDFAIRIIKFCELLDEKRKFVVAKQLLRSGTSIGANVFEAQHAESRLDFVHKMKIALKEANETRYWLLVCERSETYPADSSLKDLVDELIRILSRIVISGKKNY
ncbi:MAG: four helix bundle protein [Chitinophagaceae bacterium]|nr:four helix bundle protein [Chitinophagaceae bacterium]